MPKKPTFTPEAVYEACQAFHTAFGELVAKEGKKENAELWFLNRGAEDQSMFGRILWHGYFILRAGIEWELFGNRMRPISPLRDEEGEESGDLRWFTSRWLINRGTALVDYLDEPNPASWRNAEELPLDGYCALVHAVLVDVFCVLREAAQVRGGQNRGMREARRRQLDHAMLERRAAEYMAEYMKAIGKLPTVKQMREELGISAGAVAGLHAWRVAQALGREQRGKKPKTVPLTHDMLLNRLTPGRELAETIEEQAKDMRSGDRVRTNSR